MYGSSGIGVSVGSGFGHSLAVFPNFPSVSLSAGNGLTIIESGNQTVVNNGTLTSNGVEPYARKDGATFSGKVNLAQPTSANSGINLGSIDSTTVLTNSVAGDIWIGRFQLTFKNAQGNVVYGAGTNVSNVFGSPQIIDTTNNTLAALRVTQKGTANAIEVEDSTTPDATRFVVDANGKVGIGTAPDATAAIKIDGNGMSFNGLVVKPTSVTAHATGANTNDLLITINGVNYAIALRAV